jgi:hypothetical protein
VDRKQFRVSGSDNQAKKMPIAPRQQTGAVTFTRNIHVFFRGSGGGLIVIEIGVCCIFDMLAGIREPYR